MTLWELPVASSCRIARLSPEAEVIRLAGFRPGDTFTVTARFRHALLITCQNTKCICGETLAQEVTVYACQLP